MLFEPMPTSRGRGNQEAADAVLASPQSERCRPPPVSWPMEVKKPPILRPAVVLERSAQRRCNPPCGRSPLLLGVSLLTSRTGEAFDAGGGEG